MACVGVKTNLKIGDEVRVCPGKANTAMWAFYGLRGTIEHIHERTVLIPGYGGQRGESRSELVYQVAIDDKYLPPSALTLARRFLGLSEDEVVPWTGLDSMLEMVEAGRDEGPLQFPQR